MAASSARDAPEPAASASRGAPQPAAERECLTCARPLVPGAAVDICSDCGGSVHYPTCLVRCRWGCYWGLCGTCEVRHDFQGCPGDTPTDDGSGQVVAGPPAECGDGCTVITRRAGIVEPCGRPCGRRQPHLGRPATCMCTGHLRTQTPSTSSSDADAMAPVTGGDCSHAFEVPGTGHLSCGCVRGDHPTVGGADAFASAGDGATGVSAAFDAGRPSSGQGTARSGASQPASSQR